MSGEDLGNELSQSAQDMKDAGNNAKNAASKIGNGVNSFTNSDDASSNKLNNDTNHNNGINPDDDYNNQDGPNGEKDGQNGNGQNDLESPSSDSSSTGLDDISSSNPRRGFNNDDSDNGDQTENMNPDMVQNEPSENNEPQDENHPSGLDYDTAIGDKANNSDLDVKKDIDFGNDTGQNASYRDLDGSNGNVAEETDSGNNTDDEADDTDDNEKDDSNESGDDDGFGSSGVASTVGKLIEDIAETTVGFVFLIIFLIIIIILVIIIIVYYVASPLSLIKQSIDELSSEASAFFSELSADDLKEFWSDGVFDYEDSLLAHKIYIDDAFELAYEMAYNDIDDKLSGLDLEDEQLETAWASLAENNSASWEDVYADSNYAILYTYINVAYENSIDENIKATAEMDDDDFCAYITKESTLSQLYTVEYDLSDLDNISITIHPFCKQGLLTLVGYNSTDSMFKDITYDIYFDVSLQMLQACCSSQTAKDLNVYNELPDSFEGETSELQSIDDIVEITATATTSTEGWNMENCDYVYNALRAAGYTHEVTCGIMGNLAWESGGFKTDASDGKAYGIAQWQDGRLNGSKGLKKWCKDNNYDYTTIEGQTAFLIYELPWQITGYSSDITHNDIIYWADVTCSKFERCWNCKSYSDYVSKGASYNLSDLGKIEYGSRAGVYYIHLPQRRSNASKINEMYGGTPLGEIKTITLSKN